VSEPEHGTSRLGYAVTGGKPIARDFIAATKRTPTDWRRVPPVP
jgi:hypothetical protein